MKPAGSCHSLASWHHLASWNPLASWHLLAASWHPLDHDTFWLHYTRWITTPSDSWQQEILWLYGNRWLMTWHPLLHDISWAHDIRWLYDTPVYRHLCDATRWHEVSGCHEVIRRWQRPLTPWYSLPSTPHNTSPVDSMSRRGRAVSCGLPWHSLEHRGTFHKSMTLVESMSSFNYQ